MNALLNWIEDRTGLVGAARKCCTQQLAGGPGWRYALPSALTFTFVVQLITGVFLWMYYSAGAQSSWESVFWIQEQICGGWLLRGVHSFAGNVMLALGILWLLELVLGRLYKAPREFLFWVALAMFGALLGLLLTGDLLRWDQEGVTSTQVRTRFLLLLPNIGGELYKLAVGGNEFGNLTATRFLVLHAGVLTAALGALLCLNQWLIARHGLLCPCCKADAPAGPYWPRQAALNSIGWLAVMVVVGLLLLRSMEHGPHSGQRHGEYLGAPLGAPADPGSAYAAARPEWAFLALYQFAHMFPGEKALIPIFIVPSLLALFGILMPLVGRFLIGHLFNLAMTAALLAAAVWLSVVCIRNDRADADFQAAMAVGEADALRARLLVRAAGGAPVGGARILLAEDPKTAGPRLFQQHCASCHSLVDGAGQGIKAEKSSAPNLYRFASREWLAGLLDPKRIVSPEYFGDTTFRKGDMAGFVKDNFEEMEEDDKKNRQAALTAVSAEAGLPYQQAADAQAAAEIRKGRELMLKEYRCIDCHKYADAGKTKEKGGCPDLTGYGSRAWLVAIISNPAHQRFYGVKNDRMPVYAESATELAKNLLDAKSIQILADFLRQDWYEPKK